MPEKFVEGERARETERERACAQAMAIGESATYALAGEDVFYCFLVRAACGATFQSDGALVQQ